MTRSDKHPSPLTTAENRQRVKTALTVSRRLAKRCIQQPVVAHLIRAAKRFNDRLGNQFAAAITYFSFLSMIPLLMVSFAVAGFVLASHPTLLQDIFNHILENVPDPALATTLQNTINTAVKQRTTVGIVGLLVALYSGINWMGNLREAVSAQFRANWERAVHEKESLWLKYFRDFTGLTGLLMALIITLSITSISGSAQMLIIRLLDLDNISWLKPVWRIVGLIISICANYLLFFWIFWRLPQQRPHKTALIHGALIAAIGFELVKLIMTWMLPVLIKSPSGAAFGSVLGLMAFFYLFTRLALFCAAWIATAHSPRTHNQQQPK